MINRIKSKIIKERKKLSGILFNSDDCIKKRNDTNGNKCITLEKERWNISVILHLNNSPNSKQLIFIQIQNNTDFIFYWGHKQHEKQTVSRA